MLFRSQRSNPRPNPGIGEIIGGSQREDDYDKLLARINELGLSEDDYKFYLDLRKYGSARHAGFGLGFERCVMYLTGMASANFIHSAMSTKHCTIESMIRHKSAVRCMIHIVITGPLIFLHIKTPSTHHIYVQRAVIIHV